MSDNQYNVRLSKLENWAEQRPPSYPGRFEKTHTCVEMQALPDSSEEISNAGRIISIRDMGKLVFAHIQDHTGQIQIALTADELGQEEHKFLMKHLDIGDYIGIRGRMFTTRKGERTLKVSYCTLLSKSLRPLPEKWHGLVDTELRARQRYLDLISNDDTRERFVIRNKLIKFVRSYLESYEFFEVETPILQIASSGASARPFVTHHNALDIPLYLRIAPETYLKRLIVGGYERVYELGKCFRNEGIDPSHLQEFTMLEYYAAYWDYRDNMSFIQEMIKKMVTEATGSLKIDYQGTKIDFSGEWPEITYRDLVFKDTGIDLDKIESLANLKDEIKTRRLDLPVDQYVGLGSLIDALYKKFSRPKLIQPTFLTMHPSELVPLARRTDSEPKKLDMFQVVINSWEVVKAYSELVDPIEQYNRLLEQSALAEAGDEEAMMLEEDFVLCMEYGMPPMSGLGLGFDRIVSLVTNIKSIRDVVYFPSLRPVQRVEVTETEVE